jgi:hypothetical protein
MDDPTDGLETGPEPYYGLDLDQEVTVTAGKHAGVKGRAYWARYEGDNVRLSIKQDNGSDIWVDLSETDSNTDWISVLLLADPEGERLELLQRIKESEEGYQS